jgi:hypothetical protein
LAFEKDKPGVSRRLVSHDGPNLRQSDLKAVRKIGLWLIGCWAFFLILLWIVVYCPWFEVPPKKFEMIKDTFSLMGTYGDLFGIVGGLFSVLSIIFVAFALILQIDENRVRFKFRALSLAPHHSSARPAYPSIVGPPVPLKRLRPSLPAKASPLTSAAASPPVYNWLPPRHSRYDNPSPKTSGNASAPHC